MIKTASSDGYTFLSSLNEQRSENIRSTEHDLELIGMIRDRLLNVAPELNNGRILAQISVCIYMFAAENVTYMSRRISVSAYTQAESPYPHFQRHRGVETSMVCKATKQANLP